MTPERQQIKAHAITLRKQGWTEQAIADELMVPRTTLAEWLQRHFDDNSTLGNTVKAWRNDDNHNTSIVVRNLEVSSFLGKLEDLQTDKKFPLIIADPPWNVSVENSMQFTFKDKNGKKHTDMKRNFGNWDFQGSDEEYLTNVQTWLDKLYKLADTTSWCWFWCSYKYLSHINNIGKYVGWEPKGWYVWAKTNVPPLTASINGTLLPSLEPCLIFRKGKGQLKANKVGHPNYKELPIVSGGERLRDSSNIAAKPLAILSDIIEWCSDPGDWVLDVFAGTGSTTKAALMKRRNAFIVESDKRQMTLLTLHLEEQYGEHIISS
jgi:DNA modification methylase